MTEIVLDTNKEKRMKIKVITMEKEFLRQKKITESGKVKKIRKMIEHYSFANINTD